MSRRSPRRMDDAVGGQRSLDFEYRAPLASTDKLAAIDLFAGIGGLSAGFAEYGFSLTGVDHEPVAKTVYEAAGFGTGETVNLRQELFLRDVPVLLGGPPCRPWSVMNQQRRNEQHNDHALLERFFVHALEIRPVVALMENVPALGADDTYKAGVARLKRAGFDVARAIVHYDEFGAATKRRRLFTVAVRGSTIGASSFFSLLEARRKPRSTVREAIEWLRDRPSSEVPDHDWSALKSIGNYRHLYETGRYGWTRLQYDEPAPSFGSVAKTYILHPEAGTPGFMERVISVREVLAIMGLGLSVSFPHGTPRAKRYQMAANVVSPCVSRAAAAAIRELLTGKSIGSERIE